MTSFSASKPFISSMLLDEVQSFLDFTTSIACANKQPHSGEEAEEKYHLVYAQDQKHAATLAHEWLKQYPHLPYASFTACPEGFTIGDISVPGRQPKEMD
jgi:hypothetical protein